jgi:hypothetical protein
MDENIIKLNKKLLEFAGFTDPKVSKFYSGQWDGRFTAIFPQNSEIPGERSYTPDLVNDANAQIKWIFSRIKELGLRIEFNKDYNTDFRQFPFYWSIKRGQTLVGYGEDMESPTLAFALAIEKLITNLDT